SFSCVRENAIVSEMASDIAFLIVLLLLTIFGFAGIFSAWIDWRRASAESPVPRWRHMLAHVGLVLLTFQAALFAFLLFIFFSPTTKYDFFLYHCLEAEFILVGVGFPCWLLGKNSLRWWLFGSSCFFSVASFFLVLAEKAY